MKSIKQDVRAACEEGDSRGTITMCKARVSGQRETAEGVSTVGGFLVVLLACLHVRRL